MKKNYYHLTLFVLLLSFYNIQAQTISQTYSSGDIPTSLDTYDSTCSGPAILTVQLPPGGPWDVTGIDIEYEMTAANVAYMSEQRSQVLFQNTGLEEPIINGAGSSGGTHTYNRSNVAIANGYHAGGTNLAFEMKAWRTWGSSPLCGTNYNKVDNNTWTITVHYQAAPTCIPPSNFNAVSVGNDEGEVSWTEIGTATSWNIEYGPVGFTPGIGSGTTVVSNASPHLLTGLTHLATYDVYIQSDCGGGDESPWVGPSTFQTGVFEASATYSSGDIPTSYSIHDSACNGPGTALTVPLPAGGPWEVTGIDIAYNMTAAGGAWMSEQRSRIHFQNTGDEETVISGTGSAAGTLVYNRTNLAIANGYHAGGANLVFEMHAWRSYGSSPACGTNYNKVDNNTWTITVHYQGVASCIHPQDVEVAYTTGDGAGISWTEIGAATTWDVEYGPVGFSQGSGISINTTNNPYVITGLAYLTDYDAYVRSNCGGGDESFWVGPIPFRTNADCTAYTLDIVSTTDSTIVCKGTATLEAQGLGGPNTDIYWYDAPLGGNFLGMGSTYTTPELTTTTSYWAVEVFLDQGSGNNTLPSPCTPVHGSSGCSGGDNIDNFVLSQVGGPVLINHIGTGCSTNNYGNFISDPNYTATLFPNINYEVAITHTYQTSNWVKIWIDFDFDGTFDENTELVFQSTSGSSGGQTNGTISIPANLMASNTIMRVSTRYSALPDNACQIGGTFGETHDYKITIMGASVLCESSREEVIATVSQDGDIIVPPALPYIDVNNNTTNYGNTFSASPGSSCGTTENYLNGDEVVYMYTPTQDDLIDIHLKDISGFYAGLFVYESCGDIGTNCTAGVVAGPSDDDISIEEFPVVNGQTYYIVVSSWLTQSIGYTLEINGFVCSTFPAPIGDAIQDYAAPATLADLMVDGTMSTSVLTWYSDAAGTIVIPDSTPLANNTTYYVSQTHGTCESPLLAILVQEIDCSDLDIISTVDGNVACKGSMTLQAVSGGFGSEIYWYDAQSAGNLVGTGPTYTTPVLTNSRSYWVTEVHLEQGSGGNILPSPCTPVHGSSGCSGGDNVDDFVLSEAGGSVLINHLGTGCATNNYGNYISDPNLTATMVANSTYDVAVTHTYQTSNYVKIWIDFDFDGIFDENTELVFQSTSGSTGGQTNGSFTIPSSVLGSTTIMRVSTRFGALPDNACQIGGSFGETHDYKVTVVGSSALCEAPRVEVFATVDQSGDKLVGSLNYSDSDSTINYGNSFSGTPGCGFNGNYLDGNAVVYRYSPATDDIVNIELTNVTNNSAGVFVYQSCGDVGTNCLAGAVNSSGIYHIEDFYATGGQEYFIVVTSETGSTSYTLNIYGFDCVTSLGAPIGDASQYFVGTKYLTDLDVEEHLHSTGLTWYSDAAGTTSIPESSQLVHNTTYYVAQTVLGCESDLLAITALEFDCTNMEITTTTDGLVCQSGSVTLKAQSSGVGNDIYWFDSTTATNPIFIGNTFNTPNLTTTRSYWVAEVYTEGGTGSGGPLPSYCTPTFSFGCTSGDLIDDFILKDVSGNTLLSHLGSGCSPNGYGDYTMDPNLTATLVAGQTYNFTATANFSNQRIKIWIDFNKDGTFTDSDELLYTSPAGANPTNGSFTIPITAIGNTTVMRVFDNYSSIPTSACVTNSGFGEVHDYRVTVVGASVLCESPRIEVIAEINQTLPPAPIGDSVQHACGSQSTVGDLVVLGDNIQWYDANGSLLSLSTSIQDGVIYYATQTVASCEGPALEVTVEVLDKSMLPVADRNQTFRNGETLSHLNVLGTDLLWYADIDRMVPLPDTTLLVDQTTYYVSQTEVGYCESDLFAITVHRLIGVNDPVFANVLVLPNPASDRVTISNNGPIESVELYNLLGQRIVAQSAGFHNETVLDVSFLSSGTYLLNVKIDGKTGIFKVIKE